MCGIVGIAHRAGGAPVAENAIRAMCAAITHRGPDDEGRFVEGGIGLGMRRLSIIDLSGGHQPVTNEDGSCLIVYNGEVYNYRELRDGLIRRGHAMRTHSDTETVVHLYEERGAACVEALRGMYAFALWDRNKQRLLLARDRFGIKPLYVVEAPWGLAFASELKALHAVGLVDGDLDWDAVDMYLQLGYIPAPHSPFRGVRKLLPGCTLEWDAATGASTVRRYWDLPAERRDAPHGVEEKVRSWLDDSVHAHLESDVPVAAFLSGGFDSSAVVASMATAGEKPHAFTVRYRGIGQEAADETDLARQLAGRYGAELTVVDVEPKVEHIFEPIIRALDEPLADESAIPTWLICQAVAQAGFKVALTGTGGDELFAGYRRHVGLLLGEVYSRVPGLVRRAASSLAHALPEPDDAGLNLGRVKRFLASNGSAPDRYLQMFTKLRGGLRSDLYVDADRRDLTGAREHFRSLYAQAGSPHGLSGALYLDYHTYLPDDLLALADRLSMAHSLELRVPFVDHVLVEHIFPLPDRVKIGRMQGKRLLRRAMRPRLPVAHYHAPKRGFVGPTASWLRNELRELISDELAPDRINRTGVFRAESVQLLLQEHLRRRQNREGILWALLCFSTWHRQHTEARTGPAYQPGR